MDGIVGLCIGIAGFLFLVIIHELGHFFAAKKTGVKVLEFGVGIPPRATVLAKDKTGTEYSLNWIPLGGFVRLKGEDPKDAEDFNAKDSFISASFRSKTLILLAGVIVNLFFGWLVITVLFWVGTKPLFILPDNAARIETQSYIYPTQGFLRAQGYLTGETISSGVLISQVASGSLAQTLGVTSGTTIISIDDQPVSSTSIQTILAQYIGKSFAITYEIDGVSQTKQATCPADNCLLGVVIESEPMPDITIQFPLHIAMREAAREVGMQFDMTTKLLGGLLKNLVTFNKTGVSQDVDRLSGPVGAMKIFVMISQSGSVSQYFLFLALISLALGIFNLLPIPALDGGRLLGVIIQTVSGASKEKFFHIEGYINMFFFVLLMGLGIFLMIKDYGKFWG